MFENLTYKQKFLAVIGVFILLFLASYKKNFKNMFLAKQELKNVEQKLLSAQNSFSEIYILKNNIRSLDNIIGGHTTNPEQVQQMILDFISQKGSKVNLISIEDLHLLLDKEFLIYTNQIELGGSYTDLTNLLYEIEKNFSYSRVLSAKFYTKKNYRTNTKNLYLKIILQNYEKNK